MKPALQIKFKFPKLDERLQKGRDRIYQAVAASMQTNRALLFEHEGAYSGHKKWAPLKFRNGKPLMKTGTLKKSIAPANDGKKPVQGRDGIVKYRDNVVTIGTAIKYAGVHNSGATIRPKAKKALAFDTETAGKMVLSKVVIPMRNFSDITAEDKQEFQETLKNVLVEVLSGR